MILIIGGTGKIGSALVSQLLERGVAIRVLVRDPRRGRALAERGAETILGDLKLPDTLQAALDGVQRVFLLSSSDPGQGEMHGHLIGKARGHQLELLVRISAMGARPDSPVGLIRWHAASEQQLLASEIRHVNLRCASYMQNRLSDAATIGDLGQFFGCQGDARIALVDTRDVAAVAAALLTGAVPEALATTLNVTGPQALTARDEANTLSRVLGRSIEYVDLPPHKVRGRMIDAGLPAWLADDLVAIAGEQAGGLNAEVSHVVQEVAGKEPISFEQFVTDHRDQFDGS